MQMSTFTAFDISTPSPLKGGEGSRGKREAEELFRRKCEEVAAIKHR